MTSVPNNDRHSTQRAADSASPPTAAVDAPATSEAEFRARNESMGEMLSSFGENFSTLIQQEFALAKAEATESAKKAGVGAGMLAGAAIGGFFVLLFLSLTLTWGLNTMIGLPWAGLIVTAIWAVITTVLLLVGRQRLQKIKGLPQTQQTLQEVPQTLNPAKETP